jgi:hypothetical protein
MSKASKFKYITEADICERMGFEEDLAGTVEAWTFE